MVFYEENKKIMETSSKIFLVDDDLFSLNSYSEQLKNYGYTNVKQISSGEECLRRLKEKPDVIFLDHNMEGMNGLDVLRKIKHVYPDIKVVIVTGQQGVHTAVNSLKCGAYDYILKGEEEVRHMKRILGKIEIKPVDNFEKRSFLKRLLNINLWICLVTVILTLQIGVIIYHYSSFSVSCVVTSLLLISGCLLLRRNNRLITLTAGNKTQRNV